MRHLNINPLRRPGTWFAGAAILAAFALVACNGGGGNGSDPDAELCPDSYVAGSYDSLHVPLCVMLDSGAVLYDGNCTGCHGLGGKGQAGGVPPHANADFVQQNQRKLIEILLAGYSDSIKVNGLWYNAGMPAFAESFSNREVASILTYIHVALNDSTVGTCDANNLDDEGFATCVKTLRTVATRKADSVAVWQVKAVRDSINALL
jgi:hypothetical protein